MSNFELVSELQMTRRRDFYLADSNLANPNYSNPLLEGEWLELDSNYKLARGSSNGKVCVYPVHTEKGRYDVQSLGKVNVVMMDEFEADTKIVNTTGLAVGDRLMVGDVTIGALTRRGLLKATAAATTVEVGYVTKLYSGETKIRFVRTNPVMK